MSGGHAFLELRKFLAPEFVFGAGAAWLAGRYAAGYGARRVLLVTDQGVRAVGWADRVAECLREAGVAPVIFDAVRPNPRASEVMQAAELYVAEECDALVAVGGGSPMDCAKGAGVAVSSGRHILDFSGVDRVERLCPPLICVPTTAGSGADVSQFALVVDPDELTSVPVISKSVVPDVALVDPVLTTTMPPALTADTGLDALSHAMEAYASNAASPVTDVHALTALRLIARHLPEALDRPGDLAARGAVMLGSLHAGLAFSNAILGAVHAMAHALGGRLDLPHGRCCALLLEHVVNYNFDSAPERYAEVGRILGGGSHPDAAAGEVKAGLIAAIRRLKARLGVVGGLGALGVAPDDLGALGALAAVDPCLVTNPRSALPGDLAAIYAQAI